MKKAIKAKTSGKGENIVGKVYVDKSVEGEINGKRHVPGNVAHLVEFGHGGPHPAPPHPFMRPALDEKKSEALAAVESTARVKLDEVVLKMGVKALK
jgi:HK97 gp10 family phage protein